MPGTVLSMQNIYLVKKNYANPPEEDTKPPEDSASMKFVYHQLNRYPELHKPWYPYDVLGQTPPSQPRQRLERAYMYTLQDSA